MSTRTSHDTACVPCAEALVAGTVALMTTWADPCRHARLAPSEQRELIARKIVSNLHFLREHPALSGELRQVMSMAHDRWAALADAGAGDDSVPREATVH